MARGDHCLVPSCFIRALVIVALSSAGAHAQHGTIGGRASSGSRDSSGAHAQHATIGAHASSGSRDSSVVLAPGPQYRRSAFAEGLLGRHYRELWATPIHFRVLDLKRFGGGLTPVSAHAGSQTRSLRFAGGDGRTYQFRSIVKNPLTQLAPELQNSVAAWALLDGASSSHPASLLVASALLEAVGVLHVEQTLVILPDDPALGEYRSEFAGKFGMIEEHPDDKADAASAFAGARLVLNATHMFERLDRGPEDRVDARAFLAARLMDMLMGDRDRHRDQFRWALIDGLGRTRWQPISRDHDEAFVKLDGPILERAASYFPPLITFTDRYPPFDRLNWHAREIDRRFLVELGRQTWDSVATALQATLTDSVIDAAVRHLPPEMYAVDGAAMARTLEVRRDHLTAEALGYYAFLAAEVEIHATDAPEVAEVVRVDDRHVDISIARRGQEAHPYFHREFDATETKEIRVKLWGGDDRVVVRGAGKPSIVLRIVGGKENDELIDSTLTRHVAFYDDVGRNTVTLGHGSTLNTKHYTEWIGSDSSRYPPREWGTWTRPMPWLGGGTDAGLVLGAGIIRTSYGFRKTPYASEVTARVGYATGVAAAAAELTADVRRENQTQYWNLRLLATGIETPRYYGLGNRSARIGSSEYYRVSRQLYDVEPAAVWPVGRLFTIVAGPFASYSRTSQNADRFIATMRDTLYGAGDFAQVGGRLGFAVDSRDEPSNARSGSFLSGEARIRPAIGDVKRTYGSVEGRAETYLTAMIPLRPTLALRGGGTKVWGDFPYFDAAFLGGPSSLRGYYQRRFAGDASVSGSAEVRLTLIQSRGFLPARWGIFGNGDAGRVYVNGQSPGGWHTGAGGGLWAALLDRANTATIGLTRSKEQTTVQVGLGFPR